MKISTLKKKLEGEFQFSEIFETLDADPFEPGTILMIPYYREYQRPWLTKAYHEWLKGDRMIVLVAPSKPNCRYFKKYTEVAEIRPVNLTDNNHRSIKPMIIAIYKKRLIADANFTVTFT